MNAATPRSLLLILFVLASACDMDGGPILVPDGGEDAGPEPDGGVDAGDREAPEVVDTTPAHGATDVATDAAIVIRFSEPMDEGAGTVSLSSGGEAITATESWSADGTELTLSAALPSGARVRTVLERDFTDLAGNPLAAPYSFEITTADAVAPVVTSAEPGEGATVSARTALLRIAFSETMDAGAGALSLEGGPGALGDIQWTLGGLVVPVSGLAYDTDYRVVLSGFADPAGNALDGTAYLGDGALDFATGPDTDAPRVADANPSEGQIEVRDTTSTLTVVFDEPMDTSVTQAELTVGGVTTTVTGLWSAGDTRIDFDVFGHIARNAAHSLSLAGFRDAAGNALDPVPHLADGALDFVTGVDIFAPYVGFTDPVEASSDFSFRTSSIVVVFSEAMDTTMNSVEVSDGTESFTATGSWSLSGTRLTLDVTRKLYASRTYAIDFSSFLDAGGTSLDVGHAYLGDGVLDFTMTAPTGENCHDALTIAEATSTTGGVFEWVLAPDAVMDNDGSNTCPGGNTSGVDALIRYTKTTPAASAGGTALRIHVKSAETVTNAWMSVAVLRDECDPRTVGTGASRIRCVDDDDPQHLYLDVGPGDYYVWVSRYTGSDFRGGTVQIEEIAAPPEGESCLAPYATTTPAPVYTAPATAGDTHTWTIPSDAVQAMDHAVAYNGAGAMACDTSQANSIGVDAVIALPKATDTSVGWMRLETTGSINLVAQLLDRCDGTDPAATSLVCQNNLNSSSGSTPVPEFLETTISGAAGSRYLWLATERSYEVFPGAIVTYKEIEPAAGDTCATAIPITVGTNAVTPNRPHRLPAPSCFAQPENVTWYRFTAPERFTHVRADGAANIAAVRAADGTELGCQASAAGNTPLVTFLPPGTDVCVAVASGTPVTSLSVEAFAYDGNLGVATDLGIGAPFNDTGTGRRPLTTQTTIAVTPTALYQVVGTQALLSAPITGAIDAADWRVDFGSFTRANLLGSDAVTVGETLFSLDDASTAAAPRVYRLIRDGSFEPAVWDTGSAYPATGMHAIAYDGTSLLFSTRAAAPTRFFSLSPTAPGPAVVLGDTSEVRDVAGIAADATYFYVVARTDGTTATEGIFRLERANLSAPAVRLATVDINTARASIEIDDLVAPTYLYFRADDGAVHVIADPAGAAPRHLGAINSAIGNPSNETMAIDRATGALYVTSPTSSAAPYYRLD